MSHVNTIIIHSWLLNIHSNYALSQALGGPFLRNWSRGMFQCIDSLNILERLYGSTLEQCIGCRLMWVFFSFLPHTILFNVPVVMCYNLFTSHYKAFAPAEVNTACTNKYHCNCLFFYCFYSYTLSLTHSLSHSLTHSLTLSLTHSLSHSLTHSLTHSLSHSLTHSLSHSLTLTTVLTHTLTTVQHTLTKHWAQ